MQSVLSEFAREFDATPVTPCGDGYATGRRVLEKSLVTHSHYDESGNPKLLRFMVVAVERGRK